MFNVRPPDESRPHHHSASGLHALRKLCLPTFPAPPAQLQRAGPASAFCWGASLAGYGRASANMTIWSASTARSRLCGRSHSIRTSSTCLHRGPQHQRHAPLPDGLLPLHALAERLGADRVAPAATPERRHGQLARCGALDGHRAPRHQDAQFPLAAAARQLLSGHDLVPTLCDFGLS